MGLVVSRLSWALALLLASLSLFSLPRTKVPKGLFGNPVGRPCRVSGLGGGAGAAGALELLVQLSMAGWVKLARLRVVHLMT